MKKYFTLRRAALLLALALPSLSWGFGPAPKNALVVTETGSAFQADINAVVAFLSGRLVAAGYTVTTNVGLPGGGMASYNQVWDIRAELPLTGPEITAYVAYMNGGGNLFAMGENTGCCGTRDTSIIALIASAGGGTVTIAGNSANTQTVNPPFTTSLPTITYAAVGAFTSIGSGAFISHDTSTTGGAAIFGPGTMTNAAAGVLASVLDINFMDTSGGGFGLSQQLTDNLIAYLGAPTVIPPSGPTSFTLTGPVGGPVNAASGNFSVTPNAAYTGTITITPSGGGLSTAIVKTFSGSAAAQTFTITPTSVGPVTLTPTNSGSLTNPAALTYVTPPSAPTIGTATGGASVSVAFTPPANNGGGAISLYTATCGTATANGATSPIAVGGVPAGSFVTCTVTATNAGGVSPPSAASNQVLATLPGTPAPSTISLLAVGAAALFLWKRKRLSRA